MVTNPTDPMSLVTEPTGPDMDPGLFDGEMSQTEGVQVAGLLDTVAREGAKHVGKVLAPIKEKIDKGAEKAGDVIAPGGPVLRGARGRGQQLERGEVQPADVGPQPAPEGPTAPPGAAPSDLAPQPPQPEPVAPEPMEPALRELPDLAEDAVNQQAGPEAPARSRFEPGRDAYERYIRVNDDNVNAVLTAPQRKGELLKGGLSDFNEGRIPTEADIQARIEATSQEFAGKISADKREVVTLEATQQLADLVGASPKALTAAIMGRQKGGVAQVEGKGLAETMLASRNLLVSEMKKLDGMAEAARAGGEDALLQFRYQFELVANLQRNIKGMQTEIARALGAMRIPATGDVPASEAAARQGQDLTAILMDFGGPEDVRKLAEGYLSTGAPHRKSSFVRAASKVRVLGDAIYEVWQHALLTNPVSQMKNLMGGTATLFMSDLEMAGAATIGTARRALGGQGGATFADVHAKLFGQVMSLYQAMNYAGRAFGTMQSVVPGSKIDAAQKAGREQMNAFSGKALGATGIIGGAIDDLGNILTAGRVAFRALEAGDTFYKVLAHNGKLWEDAMSEGKARGLRGQELSDFIADFAYDPPAVAMERAQAEARYITLQTHLDREGKALQTLQRLPGMRWMVPFLKTPYNSFKWAFIDRTPLGLFWGDTRRKLDAGGKDADEAWARITIGSGIAMMSMMAVYSGNLTGGGPAQPGLRATNKSLGIQPYSIKVGDQYYSIAGTEPFASILGIWADVAEITATGHLDEPELQELFAAAIAGTAYNMTNKTFMQGFATFIEAMNDPARYGESLASNFVRSIIPRGVAHAERMVDPVQREARDYIDQLKAQIPGLSESLKPRVDMWGRDFVYGNQNADGTYDGALGPDLISPIYRSTHKPNPVDEEIARIGLNVKPAGDTITIKGLDEPIGLTDGERYFYQQQAGKIAFKRLEKFTKSDAFKEMQKQSINGNRLMTERIGNKIRSIVLKSKEVARGRLLQDSEYSESLLRRIRQIQKIEAEIKRRQSEGAAQ